MTILTLPPILASLAVWKLQTNTQTFESPLSKATQTAELAGSRWAATLTWNNLPPAEHRAWLVIQARLRGAAGRCYLGPSFAYPRVGAGGGSPLVDGAGQTGTTLVVKGAAADVSGWLRAGDFFSFDAGTGRELKLCTADANSNGSGAVTIAFEPPIRVSPAANAPLEIANPTAIMRLIDDAQAAWTIKPPNLGDGSSQFVEAFPS
ncbi:MAG: hypothetical protein HQL34_13170 [Alphaproteobacteria bacterium]|nr:hypothetical protein [Alphaproteobacteria bacterium]